TGRDELPARLVTERPSHAGGDVLDAEELIDLEIRAPRLGLAVGSEKPGGQVVLPRTGEVRKALLDAVVIREDEACGRNEARRAAARDSCGAQAHTLEPVGVGGEAVGLADSIRGKGVERPQALVGPRASGGKEKQQEGGKPRAADEG